MLLRPALVYDAAAIARVEVSTWRDAYREILPARFLAALREETQAQQWRALIGRPGHVMVVVEDYLSGEVVGFSSGGPERGVTPQFSGEVFTLYVAPAWQRAGLGRRLFAAVAERLVRAGRRSLVVRALAENPARQLYETLGGRFLGFRSIRVGGLLFDEASYGWDDAGPLVGRYLTGLVR